MQFGISLPNFGTYHDPRLIARLAREAEAAGWDGFFLWDHVLWTWPEVQPGSDPYVMLAAIAMSTERIRFGALVTPIARRRPWKMARELTTLDQLSGGRVVLGAGIGGDWFGDYSKFGEPAPADDKMHAEMLDEGLEVICGLWSGKSFSFEGKHYKIEEAQFLPKPVQTPRIPVWIAGIWPHKRPFRRAAQWDGVLPLPSSDPPRELRAQETADLLAYIMEHRTSSEPFDVVVSGRTTGTDATKDAEKVGPLVEAGATWWIEGFSWNEALDVVEERIGHGPPSIR